MVINDLKQTCERCKGRKHEPGFVAMGVNQINYGGRCPVCKGRGFTLTELGHDVLNFMRPFMEELVEEMIAGLAEKQKAAAEEHAKLKERLAAGLRGMESREKPAQAKQADEGRKLSHPLPRPGE